MSAHDQHVFIVGGDKDITASIPKSLDLLGVGIQTFQSTQEFLSAYDRRISGCLVVNYQLPDMNGLDFQQALARLKISLPTIFLADRSGITESVQAMKAGAFDFLERSIFEDVLLERIGAALAADRAQRKIQYNAEEISNRFGRFTQRERQIAKIIVSNKNLNSSKAIAQQLGISHRTVDQHRANIMSKTQTHSIVEFIQLAEQAGFTK